MCEFWFVTHFTLGHLVCALRSGWCSEQTLILTSSQSLTHYSVCEKKVNKIDPFEVISDSDRQLGETKWCPLFILQDPQGFTHLPMQSSNFLLRFCFVWSYPIFSKTFVCFLTSETTTEKQSPPTFSEQRRDQVSPSFLQQDDASISPTVRDFYKVRGFSISTPSVLHFRAARWLSG